MEEDVLIKVEGLGKKFSKDLKKSLLYGIQDIGREIIGKGPSNKLRKTEFWALKDINFELKRGECLGLLGHNGAGKSTLLKALNGLLKPDEGSVQLKGRVAALIELGAGFNPILTGRENIYNNASVLGFSKKEIEDKIEDIIDFSEIRPFIDSPVQNYSSGMKVRLGFAVASQLEPDILFIDEVLAVGDIGFRIKCYNKIAELLPKTAIIFVSHSMVQVAKICTSGMLMDAGKSLHHSTNVGEGIQLYFEKFENSESASKNEGEVKISSFKINGLTDKNEVHYNDDLELLIKFENNSHFKNVSLEISFTDNEMKAIAISIASGIDLSSLTKKVIIKNLPITGGKYTINIVIRECSKDSRQGILISHYRKIDTILVKGGDMSKFCPIQLPNLIFNV